MITTEHPSVPSGIAPVPAPDVDRLADEDVVHKSMIEADKRNIQIDNAAKFATSLSVPSSRASLDELDNQFDLLDFDDTASTVSDRDLHASTPKIHDDDDSSSDDTLGPDELSVVVDTDNRIKALEGNRIFSFSCLK